MNDENKNNEPTFRKEALLLSVRRDGKANGLIHGKGYVSEVGFPPGAPFIRLLFDGRSMSVSATTDQASTALSLRGEEAEFVVMYRKGKKKLLWIKGAGEALPLSDKESRTKYLLEKWESLLRRLS